MKMSRASKQSKKNLVCYENCGQFYKTFLEVIEISPKLRMDKLHKNAKQFYFSTILEWPLLVVSLNDEIYILGFLLKKVLHYWH